MLTRLFLAVLILSLVLAVPVKANVPAVPPNTMPHASFLYCATAYISLLSSIWNNDAYGEFMSEIILAYQC
jgi:hypothetical protein